MIDSTKKSKPTLASLLKECKVITGKDLIKWKEDKEKELALFQEAQEFEKRNRKSIKIANIDQNSLHHPYMSQN